MAMNDFFTSGYGIRFNCTEASDTTPQKIRELLDLAPCLKAEVTEYLNECCETNLEDATIEDFEDFEQDFSYGIPYLLSEAINEKYGSDFVCCLKDYDGFTFVLMPKGMPWEFEQFEKPLTEEKLKSFFEEFYNVLYEKNIDFGEVTVHDFG